MKKGTVMWFNAAKGSGFIQPKGSEKDDLVNQTGLEAACPDRLAEGQDVTFDIVTDGNGRQFVASMALA